MRRGEKLGADKRTLAFFDQMRQHQEIGCDVYPTQPALQRWISNKSPTNSILYHLVTNTSAAGRENTGANRHDWQMSMLEAAKLLMPAGAIYTTWTSATSAEC